MYATTGPTKAAVLAVAGAAATHRANRRVKPVTVTAMAMAMALSPRVVRKAPGLPKMGAAKVTVKAKDAHLATTTSPAKVHRVPPRVNLTPCGPAWT